MKALYESREYKSGVPVSVFKTDNLDFWAHWHTEVELVYVLEGSLHMGINKESRTLHKGDMAVCSSSDIHYYDGKGFDHTIIVVIFRPEFIGFPGGWPENLYFVSPFIDTSILSKTHPDAENQIKDIFCTLLYEINTKGDYYPLMVKSKLIEICTLAMRYFPSRTVGSENESRRLSGIKMMQEALKYLEENYMSDISLDDISGNMNISPFHFSRLFKRISGMSFKTYLNSIRVKKAEHMIADGSMKMTDIAFQCGFSSIRTFNRAFYQIKGCTPSSLR